MKQIKTLLVLFFFVGINLIAQQKEDYSKYPGYLNYKNISGLNKAESLSEVYLEESLLKMFAGMAEEKNDDISELVNGLKLIQVNEYKIGINTIAEMESSLDAMDKSLQSTGWNRIVRTNNKSNLVNIYIKKSSSGEFEGLAILSLSKGGESAKSEKAEPYGKVTCVNIVGKIDLAKIGKLTKQFNIPGLDKMKEKEKKND
ncbi:hypothetical protein C0389_09875 [bacterium]|nr:hypothetical protein [bacterium]